MSAASVCLMRNRFSWKADWSVAVVAPRTILSESCQTRRLEFFIAMPMTLLLFKRPLVVVDLAYQRCECGWYGGFPRPIIKRTVWHVTFKWIKPLLHIERKSQALWRPLILLLVGCAWKGDGSSIPLFAPSLSPKIWALEFQWVSKDRLVQSKFSIIRIGWLISSWCPAFSIDYSCTCITSLLYCQHVN